MTNQISEIRKVLILDLNTKPQLINILNITFQHIENYIFSCVYLISFIERYNNLSIKNSDECNAYPNLHKIFLDFKDKKNRILSTSLDKLISDYCNNIFENSINSFKDNIDCILNNMFLEGTGQTFKLKKKITSTSIIASEILQFFPPNQVTWTQRKNILTQKDIKKFCEYYFENSFLAIFPTENENKKEIIYQEKTDIMNTENRDFEQAYHDRITKLHHDKLTKLSHKIKVKQQQYKENIDKFKIEFEKLKAITGSEKQIVKFFSLQEINDLQYILHRNIDPFNIEGGWYCNIFFNEYIEKLKLLAAALYQVADLNNSISSINLFNAQLNDHIILQEFLEYNVNFLSNFYQELEYKLLPKIPQLVSLNHTEKQYSGSRKEEIYNLLPQLEGEELPQLGGVEYYSDHKKYYYTVQLTPSLCAFLQNILETYLGKNFANVNQKEFDKLLEIYQILELDLTSIERFPTLYSLRNFSWFKKSSTDDHSNQEDAATVEYKNYLSNLGYDHLIDVCSELKIFAYMNYEDEHVYTSTISLLEKLFCPTIFHLVQKSILRKANFFLIERIKYAFRQYDCQYEFTNEFKSKYPKIFDYSEHLLNENSTKFLEQIKQCIDNLALRENWSETYSDSAGGFCSENEYFIDMLNEENSSAFIFGEHNCYNGSVFE